MAGIYVVERRGTGKRLHPRRHVEISTVLESMPEAVFIFDTDARVVDLNGAAEGLCRTKREEIRGLSAAELCQKLASNEECAAANYTEQAVARALRGEKVRDERHVFTGSQRQQPLEVLVSANPMREPNGQVVGALVIVRDVTELTQLQRHLSDTQRHHAIGQMAAGLAHDFNNVLDTISQAAIVLQMNEAKPPADRRRYLGMINNAVLRGAEIIQQVREYLRTGTGKTEILNLSDLLEECIELTRPLWQATGISIKREFQPDTFVRASAADMRRVFTNLIINAIEVMPQGGQLTVSCDRHNGRVRAAVADTGLGIAPEQQKKIFDPYFTTKQQGTGLGLSSAQRIVISQGGNISFSSQPGKGTRFQVELPSAAQRRPPVIN
jgi:PAS domain S-box-containing protein